MSDSYFIGTVARVHRLLRRNDDGKPRGDEDFQRKIREAQKASFVDGKSLKESGHSNQEENNPERRRELGMMVSLDHTIYFHRPREFRADEWMFTEMDSPWAGDGRGLVMQRMYTKDGKLIATCVQEVCHPRRQPGAHHADNPRVLCGFGRRRAASCNCANLISIFRAFSVMTPGVGYVRRSGPASTGCMRIYRRRSHMFV